MFNRDDRSEPRQGQRSDDLSFVEAAFRVPDFVWPEQQEAVTELRPPSPSDFLDVKVLVPGEAPIEWDGLNTPSADAGVIWVDVDLAQGGLRSLQEILPRLCPGFPAERVTDFFMVDLEGRFDDRPAAMTPDVSIVRSFFWLVTCWHGDATHGGTHRAVEERWRELGPRGASTAGDLASLFIDEITDRRGATCHIA
jgi:hypothetical protein